MRPLLPPRLDDLTVAGLTAYLRDTWALDGWLYSGLVEDAAFFARGCALRHPLIFYYGHSAAFFVAALRFAGLRDGPVDRALDARFARGVDPAEPEALAPQAWPDRATVEAYRGAVWAAVEAGLARLRLRSPVTPTDPAWALLMAAEHARVHFETSSVLIRMLPTSGLRAPAGWIEAPRDARGAAADWRAVPAGPVTLGKPAAWPTFGWDNEYGARTESVAAFSATTPVTNAAYRAFVDAGGYDAREHWSEAGWRWRVAAEARHPRFWTPAGADWQLRTVFAEGPFAPGWPVEVNRFEAEACCRWAGARLPTEAEHARLSAAAPRIDGDVLAHPAYNLNLRWCSPRAVAADDAHGNVWQWLADDFAPLPGFAPHPLYPDFSAPYFGRAHGMMTGGAWASTGTSASRFYRLWFRPRFFQHAGFRMVRSA